jgi:DNA replication protein DnaC
MACAQCDGTGWRPIERDGIRRVERCECWQQSITTKALEDSLIPKQYARCTLESFVTYPNDKMSRALAYGRKFVESFPVVSKGIFLIGPPGIGKTHLSVGILRAAIQRTGTRGLFYDVRELLKVIRSTYNPVVRTAEMDILRPVMQCKLLVLDDLGAEKPSEWVEETLNLIVNTRYNDRLPTIFTSNFEDSPDATDPDALLVRVGFRMHSRLHEMCEFLEFDGADYRFLPPNGGPDDLVTMWKKAPNRKVVGTKSRVMAKAQLQSAQEQRAPRELNWPGGKAGRG